MSGLGDKPMPKHVAIIMDGNGRWASARGLQRTQGHRRGIEALRRTVKAAADFGIQYLTIYSFSTENWSRPRSEITFLLDLLRRFIRQDVAELHAAGVRIRMIGDRVGLDPAIVKLIEDAELLTSGNEKLTLFIAFNYGSRQELTRAVQTLVLDIAAGRVDPNGITMEHVAARLDTAGIPDPDLLIRTGGEARISNFLLWQCAYTEFVFVPEYWPDFNAEVFHRAVVEFGNRERRFGGLKVKLA
jgi:undecaprenyl diphosphate synthase